MFDISLYTAAIIVHVGAASILVGSSVVAPLTRRSLLAADSLGSVRMWLAFDRRVAKADPPAALVLLASGIYLGSAGWWTQPWFYVAAVVWIACSVIAATLLQNGAKRLEEAIGGREGAVDAAVEAARGSRRWDIGHELLRGFDASMLYVMFQKPGVIESLVVIAAAIGLSIGLGRRHAHVTRSQAVAITNSPEPV